MEKKLSPQQMKKMAMDMQDPHSGLKLKDRRDFLHTYKDTFLGCEAKIWMQNYLTGDDKFHAEEILQVLKDDGIFTSCTKKSSAPFRADKEIYIFNSLVC